MSRCLRRSGREAVTLFNIQIDIETVTAATTVTFHIEPKWAGADNPKSMTATRPIASATAPHEATTSEPIRSDRGTAASGVRSLPPLPSRMSAMGIITVNSAVKVAVPSSATVLIASMDQSHDRVQSAVATAGTATSEVAKTATPPKAEMSGARRSIARRVHSRSDVGATALGFTASAWTPVCTVDTFVLSTVHCSL